MSKIVFCDFDGTITAVETFAGMLKEFAPDLSKIWVKTPSF
jgi:2-hydroxy-3-keto-5-methylthiopentenyl-1-phosphate phosphatase